MIPISKAVEKLLARSTPGPDGCILSGHGVGSHGYAQIFAEGRNQLAHRVVWIHHYGEIPYNETVDHLCHNRTCINIEHLRCISNFENARRTHGRDWPLGECANGHGNQHLVQTKAGKHLCSLCATEQKLRWAKNNPEKVRAASRKYEESRKS